MKQIESPLLLSEEELKVVEDMSSVNYGPEKIAMNLGVDKRQFLREFFKKTSEVRMAYDRGQLTADFAVNSKQMELAKSGNITSAQIFLKEAEARKIETLRNQILYGNASE